MTKLELDKLNYYTLKDFAHINYKVPLTSRLKGRFRAVRPSLLSKLDGKHIHLLYKFDNNNISRY